MASRQESLTIFSARWFRFYDSVLPRAGLGYESVVVADDKARVKSLILKTYGPSDIQDIRTLGVVSKDSHPDYQSEGFFLTRNP